MPKFTVTGKSSFIVFKEVEAENEEEALRIAQEDDSEWIGEEWLESPVPVSVRKED